MNVCCNAYSITRAGGFLLFRVLRQSTIGVKGFHSRVRDGIACFSFAITTGSSNAAVFGRLKRLFNLAPACMQIIHTNEEQDNQAISTDRLRASQRFHPRPINVVVFHGLNGDTLFQGRLPA